MKKPKTVKAMIPVWNRLLEQASEDKFREKEIAKAFNEMLDSLLGDDFFGTEGQRDPRGDHRSNEF